MIDDTYTKTVLGIISACVVALIPSSRKMFKGMSVLRTEFIAQQKVLAKHEKDDERFQGEVADKFHQVTEKLDTIQRDVGTIAVSVGRIEGRMQGNHR